MFCAAEHATLTAGMRDVAEVRTSEINAFSLPNTIFIRGPVEMGKARQNTGDMAEGLLSGSVVEEDSPEPTSYRLETLDRVTLHYRDSFEQGVESPVLEGLSPQARCKVSFYGRPIPRALRATFEWISGPTPPRRFVIRPLFARIEDWLTDLQRRSRTKRLKGFLFFVLSLYWSLSFVLLVWKSNSACKVPGFDTVVKLSCISRLW